MVTLWIYDRNRKEAKLLLDLSKDIFAYLSDEKLETEIAAVPESIKKILPAQELLDAALWEVAADGDIRMLKTVRKDFRTSEILIIAESTISPMEYLTPDIRAASLLVRPFGRKQAASVLREFLESVCRAQDTPDERKIVVENQQGKISLPVHQIYYVEVRERKVFLRLRTKEYGQYTTMENMMELLPDSFVRCHRSYAVNTRYLERIKLSENTIYLRHGLEIPLSRSYKPALKEYMDRLRRSEGSV